jgi:hypothetical protein
MALVHVVLAVLLAATIWYGSTSWVLSHCGDGLVASATPAALPAAAVLAGDAAPRQRRRRSLALPAMRIPPAVARHPAVKKRASRLQYVLAQAAKGTAAGSADAVDAAAAALAEALLEAARTVGTTSALPFGGAGSAAAGVGGSGGGAARRAAADGADDDSGAFRGKPADATPLPGGAEPEVLPEFTQQTCYLQSDESELCVYDGVFCFDGKSPVVVVDRPIRAQERILDYTHSCSDFRYYEPSALDISGCGYGYSSYRPYNASLPIRPGTDYPLPLTRRRWGAQNRNGHLYFKEVPPEEVWGPPAPPAARAGGGFPARAPDGRPALWRYSQLLREERYGGNPGVHVPWSALAPPHAFSPSGAYGASLVREGPFEHEDIAGLRVVRRTRVGNRTINWVDGALWLAGIDGQFWQNPYHWWTKMGALFDALRANASHPAGWGGHPDDGYVHASYRAPDGGEGIDAPGARAIRGRAGGGSGGGGATWNRASWRVGPQWRLPPMDYVSFTGDGAIVLPNVTALHAWFRATMALATQPHSVHFFNDLIRNLDDYNYVCTTRGGAVPGTKHKLFTSRSDAALLRQYAYDVVAATTPSPSPSPSAVPKRGSVTPTASAEWRPAAAAAAVAARRATLSTSYPRHAPRKVTIIGRKGQNGRGIYNIDRVVAAVNATGLPLQMVSTMATLSFEEQVQLMAGTGLLIAPHGAHLQNIMFLPAHAAVIELWPFLMKKSTYRHLATQLDLHYFPVYSWDLLPMTPFNCKTFYGVELMNKSYYYDHCVALNISSYEALTEHACNAMSKNYPIIVPFPAFDHILADALDAIGAFALANDAWMALAPEQGQPLPPPPGDDVSAAHTHATPPLPAVASEAFAALREGGEGG